MWPSGRRRSPAKGVGPKGSRGFESHRLRHYTDLCPKFTAFANKSARFPCFARGTLVVRRRKTSLPLSCPGQPRSLLGRGSVPPAPARYRVLPDQNHLRRAGRFRSLSGRQNAHHSATSKPVRRSSVLPCCCMPGFRGHFAAWKICCTNAASMSAIKLSDSGGIGPDHDARNPHHSNSLSRFLRHFNGDWPKADLKVVDRWA
jgi:hypothetical protein